MSPDLRVQHRICFLIGQSSLADVSWSFHKYFPNFAQMILQIDIDIAIDTDIDIDININIDLT